jgi:hypothetical protein
MHIFMYQIWFINDIQRIYEYELWHLYIIFFFIIIIILVSKKCYHSLFFHL